MKRILKSMMAAQDQPIDNVENCLELSHDYLKIAEGRIYRNPTLVQTVLGSCVSVTMFCPQHRCGGIFHALLPSVGDFSKNNNGGPDCFRYVDSSIWSLLNKFERSGISANSLECKVFGGSSPLHRNDRSSAGSRNVKIAMEVLTEAGAAVIASSVGGNGGRKIYFRTDTGTVFQKQFSVNH